MYLSTFTLNTMVIQTRMLHYVVWHYYYNYPLLSKQVFLNIMVVKLRSIIFIIHAITTTYSLYKTRSTLINLLVMLLLIYFSLLLNNCFTFLRFWEHSSKSLTIQLEVNSPINVLVFTTTKYQLILRKNVYNPFSLEIVRTYSLLLIPPYKNKYYTLFLSGSYSILYRLLKMYVLLLRIFYGPLVPYFENKNKLFKVRRYERLQHQFFLPFILLQWKNLPL